jgi:phage shock protein PspC (stress-responsive transcriptional regulator)
MSKSLCIGSAPLVLGVCGGVAEFFGLNLVKLRIAAIVFTLFLPVMPLIYIAIAILVNKRPESKGDRRRRVLSQQDKSRLKEKF